MKKWMLFIFIVHFGLLQAQFASEPSSLVSKNIFQIETGAFFDTYGDKMQSTQNFAINSTLLRFGLFKNVELRTSWIYNETKFKAKNSTLTDEKISEFSPFLIGIKGNLFEEKNRFPEISVMSHAYFPFASKDESAFNAKGLDFSFLIAHNFGKKSNLTYNLGGYWEKGIKESLYFYTTAYTYTLLDNLVSYIELYGDFQKRQIANHLLDVGVTYTFKPNLELDVAVGRSITEGQDFLVNFVLVIGIPM